MTSFHTRLHSMSLIVQRSDNAADKSSTRFDYPILAKMFRKFIIRSINEKIAREIDTLLKYIAAHRAELRIL